MTSGTPPADYEVSEKLVRRLLTEQFPEYCNLPVSEFAAGWDNVMFRLGENLAVRMPRRELGARIILNEQKFLSQIESSLSLPAPVPVAIGQATNDYPCSWSIVPWLEGEPADLHPAQSNQATVLADFLKGLHQPAPPEFPQNPYRGIPLIERFDHFNNALVGFEHYYSPRHLKLWDQAMAAKPHRQNLIIHGDLHPQNILTENGKLSAIIDWGDICSGDAANDLGAFYLLFDDPEAVRNYTNDPDLIARARGWTLLFISLILKSCTTKTSRHAKTCLKALETLAKAPLMP